ncbi:hypothetical protein PRECH8_11340 [Insulibacter thermoxylanivorax]|uniref:Uncharacterized protein n=1 Tax=Insulibacter thermoxylanivorax TaxID=2749268 RepID=A0A916VFF8_9BACL|nr:hypothetical protein PRECH8_11340 [Insulibacter thermoxylanivorax]
MTLTIEGFINTSCKRSGPGAAGSIARITTDKRDLIVYNEYLVNNTGSGVYEQWNYVNFNIL